MNQGMTEEDHPPIHRPFRVTLLALGVLSIAVFHWVAFIQCIHEWDILVELLPFTPAITAGINFFWGTAGIFLTWGLFSGQSWTPKLLRICTLAYLVLLWTIRMLLFSNEGRGENTPFVAVLSVLSVAYIFWVLYSRKVKIYFGEIHER